MDYESLQRPFPRELIKQREGAHGKMLDYVGVEAVIRRLIEATGNHYDFHVDKIEAPMISYQKYDKDTRSYVDAECTLYTAFVSLTIDGCTRQHVGTCRDDGNLDDGVKGAVSDGLKKAATLWGVALELYEDRGQEAQAPPRAAEGPQTGNSQPTKYPATEAQIKFFNTISHSDCWDMKQRAFAVFMESVTGQPWLKDPASLSKKQMSAALDALNNLTPEQIDAMETDSLDVLVPESAPSGALSTPEQITAIKRFAPLPPWGKSKTAEFRSFCNDAAGCAFNNPAQLTHDQALLVIEALAAAENTAARDAAGEPDDIFDAE